MGKQEQQHHFYGSTAITWAVAETREKVIEMLAKDAGKDVISRLNKNPDTGGLYFWTCKVEKPKSANYEIEYYKPVGVPISESMHGLIKDVKGTFEEIER